jgi:hypothetical protein
MVHEKRVGHPPKPVYKSVSGKGWHEQLGENTSYRHGRGRILGISPLPFGRFTPSESVEMTDISSKGGSSVLYPNE